MVAGLDDSLDDNIKINTSANWKLRIHKVDDDWHVDSSFEILRWKALLWYTNYLLQLNENTNAYSLCGDILSLAGWHLSEQT